MEVSDAAWRAVMASIDRYETGEQLLEALLNDTPSPPDPPTIPSSRLLSTSATEISLMQRWPQATGEREMWAHTKPPASSSMSLSSTDCLDASVDSALQRQPPKKRRCAPQTRPKEELDRLRESYSKLTALLQLLEQRRAKRISDSARPPAVSPDAIVTARVWKAVAGRQYQHLHDSQALNQKMRMQLRTQMNVIQSFIRLTKRAQAGLPTSLVPQSLTDRQSELFGSRRARLLSVINDMAAELRTTLQEDPFSRRFDGDFRDVWFPKDGVDLPTNAVLATSSAGYLAPRSQRIISERWWERIRKRTSRIQDLHFKHVDRGDDSETVSYSVGFATAIGSAAYSGLAMSRRVHLANSDDIVFLGVHELRLTENTQAPMTAVEYRMETVSLIQSFQTCDEFSQVVVKTHATRLEHPLVPNLSESQASILRRFVSDTLDFLHVQLQQQLDADMSTISNE